MAHTRNATYIQLVIKEISSNICFSYVNVRYWDGHISLLSRCMWIFRAQLWELLERILPCACTEAPFISLTNLHLIVTKGRNSLTVPNLLGSL